MRRDVSEKIWNKIQITLSQRQAENIKKWGLFPLSPVVFSGVMAMLIGGICLHIYVDAIWSAQVNQYLHDVFISDPLVYSSDSFL